MAIGVLRVIRSCLGSGKRVFLVKDERCYEFPTLLLVLFPNNLPLDDVDNTMLVPWAHGSFTDSLILRNNRCSLWNFCHLKERNLTGPGNFETHAGHLVFYFNLISPFVVSGSTKQKIRSMEWGISHWKLPWLFPSQYTGRHHVVWGIHLQI